MVLFSSFNTSIRVNSASFKILSQPSKKVLSVTPIHGIFSICTLLVQFVVIDTHLKRVRDVELQKTERKTFFLRKVFLCSFSKHMNNVTNWIF